MIHLLSNCCLLLLSVALPYLKAKQKGKGGNKNIIIYILQTAQSRLET